MILGEQKNKDLKKCNTTDKNCSVFIKVMGAMRYYTKICEDITVQPMPLSLHEFKDKVLHHWQYFREDLPVNTVVTWSSYFLSLSQIEMEEGWAPLWAGEGLWLLRLGDWKGLRLSPSPRRWSPLLQRARLEPPPWRELERDLKDDDYRRQVIFRLMYHKHYMKTFR